MDYFYYGIFCLIAGGVLVYLYMKEKPQKPEGKILPFTPPSHLQPNADPHYLAQSLHLKNQELNKRVKAIEDQIPRFVTNIEIRDSIRAVAKDHKEMRDFLIQLAETLRAESRGGSDGNTKLDSGKSNHRA